MGFKLIIGLEDISIFRAVPNSIVLYPADVISTEIAVKLVLGHQGSLIQSFIKRIHKFK
jgi:transketolase C-terminal domain/subunit